MKQFIQEFIPSKNTPHPPFTVIEGNLREEINKTIALIGKTVSNDGPLKLIIEEILTIRQNRMKEASSLQIQQQVIKQQIKQPINQDSTLTSLKNDLERLTQKEKDLKFNKSAMDKAKKYLAKIDKKSNRDPISEEVQKTVGKQLDTIWESHEIIVKFKYIIETEKLPKYVSYLLYRTAKTPKDKNFYSKLQKALKIPTCELITHEIWKLIDAKYKKYESAFDHIETAQLTTLLFNSMFTQSKDGTSYTGVKRKSEPQTTTTLSASDNFTDLKKSCHSHSLS